MTKDQDFDLAPLPPDSTPRSLEGTDAIADAVRLLAGKHRRDCSSLLALLRLLENLHREIREELFLDTLPTNRQDLYALLRDMEAEGGWPYIPRPNLRNLIEQLSLDSEDNTTTNNLNLPHDK
ncbi:hypothetical protein [[Phormidium] sp. ETS-05]|uniref:hypothetical protein n=1 Tax=[Phormidium] sp. ETS-05 TaxID=222819 RepID=UPI001E4238E7|nr:hypothetical protein [[Phormidium] sp. ETS-05]